MSEMTLRKNLEAIQGFSAWQGAPIEVAADALMKCSQLAEAAIKALNAAAREDFEGETDQHALIYDPEHPDVTRDAQ